MSSSPTTRPYYSRSLIVQAKLLSDPADCWVWPGHERRGFGVLRNLHVHRIAYEMFVGPLTPDVLLTQACGNKRCFNPGHMSVGPRATGQNYRQPSRVGLGSGVGTGRAPRPVRSIVVESGLAKIPLPGGLWGLIDIEDVPLVEGKNWYAKSKGETTYVVREAGVDERAAGEPKNVYLHRLILNPPEGFVSDHISGDGLDNRRCNLRLATQRQNTQNRRVGKNSPHGVKGVKSHRDGFEAVITVNKKVLRLGVYPTVVEAAAVYDKAAKMLHGEFARPNAVAAPEVMKAAVIGGSDLPDAPDPVAERPKPASTPLRRFRGVDALTGKEIWK